MSEETTEYAPAEVMAPGDQPRRSNTPATRTASQLPAETPDNSGLALVQMIERVALNPKIPMERLEKLLDMKERLDIQQARKAFDRAVADAKQRLPRIVKNRRVYFESRDASKPATDYWHEDLAGIAEQIDPILGEFGLSYRFRTQQEGAIVTVTCILAHRDGHSEETSLSGGPDTSGSKNSYQQVGSAVTYLQRYTLKASLGLASAHDDDAQGASPQAPAPATITAEQKHSLFVLIDAITESGFDVLPNFLTAEAIESVDDLPAKKFDHARIGLVKLAKTRGLDVQ